MPAAKYIVDLTKEEREELLKMIRSGKESSRKLNRARILLKADEGLQDWEVAEALNTGTATVGRVRKRFVEEGFEAALSEKTRPGARPKLSTKQQAHIIALACSKSPEGHARWTLRLLAGKVVELGFSEKFSYETVRRIMKKTDSSRGKRRSGASQK